MYNIKWLRHKRSTRTPNKKETLLKTQTKKKIGQDVIESPRCTWMIFDLNDTYTPPQNTLINEGLEKYPQRRSSKS